MQAFVGLGSNIGDGEAMLQRALEEVDQVPEIEVVRHSSFYLSAPLGMENQPHFTNAVAEVATSMTPGQLLTVLQAIEIKLGRTRDTGRWGPRTMDLDLLCCEQMVILSEELVIPHPRLHQRAFVLLPLLELDSELLIPGVGFARDCLSKLPDQGVRRIP